MNNNKDDSSKLSPSTNDGCDIKMMMNSEHQDCIALNGTITGNCKILSSRGNTNDGDGGIINCNNVNVSSGLQEANAASSSIPLLTAATTTTTINGAIATSGSQEAQSQAAVLSSLLATATTGTPFSSNLNTHYTYNDSAQSYIGPNDVLLGRGGGTNHHIGNRRFRELVKDYQPIYLKAKKLDKAAVAKQIVSIVYSRSGRFLIQKSPDINGIWEEVSPQRAREKTSQALRENLIIRSSQIRPSKYSNSSSTNNNTNTQPQPTDIDTKEGSSSLVYHHQLPPIIQQQSVSTVPLASSTMHTSYFAALVDQLNQQVRQVQQVPVVVPSNITTSSSTSSLPASKQQQQRKRRPYTIKKSFVTGTVVQPSSNNTTDKSTYSSQQLSHQQLRKEKRLQQQRAKTLQQKPIPVPPSASTTSESLSLQSSASNNNDKSNHLSPSIVSISSSCVMSASFNPLQSNHHPIDIGTTTDAVPVVPKPVPISSTTSKTCSAEYKKSNNNTNKQMTTSDNMLLDHHPDKDDNDDTIKTALAMVRMATNRT